MVRFGYCHVAADRRLAPHSLLAAHFAFDKMIVYMYIMSGTGRLPIAGVLLGQPFFQPGGVWDGIGGGL